MGRSQWPRGLRRRCTAARLLRSWVRIHAGLWYPRSRVRSRPKPSDFSAGKIHSIQYDTTQTTIESPIPGQWGTRYGKKNPTGGMDVCLFCVLSCRGLSDELITRPEESYRLWRVVMCDQETSWYDEAIARAGLQSQRNIWTMDHKI
jgi:hypothetical protein